MEYKIGEKVKFLGGISTTQRGGTDYCPGNIASPGEGEIIAVNHLDGKPDNPIIHIEIRFTHMLNATPTTGWIAPVQVIEPFKRQLCGQRIDDGKPCGCGAR
jgi:hypothetical protein